METKPLNKEELIRKIEALKKKSGADLSTEEDLSIGIMNLISLEEHLFFTAEKTGKGEYFDLVNDVRTLRKEMMAKMIDAHEGETWCITKHLLAATMRLMEVGTKYKSDGKAAEAKEMFDRAYHLYSIFWALRLKLITVADTKKIAAEEKPWTLKDIVDKLVDCCDE